MGAEAANQSNGTNGASSGTTTQQTANAQQGGEAPGPVPYAVFSETNRKLREAETQRDAFKSQLDAGGPKVQELESKLGSVREEMGVRVALARAGVSSDPAMDYLVSRYASIEAGKRPKADDFVGQLKSIEPAFFGVPAATTSTATTASTGTQQASASGAQAQTGSSSGGATTSNTQARTSPDATRTTAQVNGQDPPLSEEAIKQMDQETFNRRWPEIEAFMNAKRKGR